MRPDPIEGALMRRFAEIRPIEPGLVPDIEHYKDGRFGNAYAALLLYCGGPSSAPPSSRKGLVYIGDQAAFGVGVFGAERPARREIHLVAPRGDHAVETATELARFVLQERPEIKVSARHLTIEQYDDFLRQGWRSSVEAPWSTEAPQEDETFNHRLIELTRLLDVRSTSNPIRVLSGTEARWYRNKARLAYQRFQNFLRRNEARFSLVAHDVSWTPLVEGLIAEHFDEMRAPCGSRATDYAGLIQFVPEPDDPRYCSRVGILAGPGWQRAVSFFVAERIDESTFGCFASITRRNRQLLPPLEDVTGFSAVAQFALLEFLRHLAQAGVRYIDLGGSETRDLDRFKQQLGAEERPTFWATFMPREASAFQGASAQ